MNECHICERPATVRAPRSSCNRASFRGATVNEDSQAGRPGLWAFYCDRCADRVPARYMAEAVRA